MNVKTVVIINDFNYTQGGASKVAIDTAKLLKEKGLDTYFFSAVNKIEENIEGIKYITTNQNEALKEKNKIVGIINGIYNFKARSELKKLLESLDNKTTILHVHGWTKALSSSVFDIAFKMNFKVVLTLHDYFTACPNGGYYNYNSNKICKLNPLSWKCIKCNCDSRNYLFKLYRIIRQFVQNKIVKLNDKLQYVISISNFSENILKETLGKQVQIKKICNPIDIDNVKNIINFKENNYFLYVGRITKEKGVDLFCKAITDLNLKGIVVGTGNEKANLEKQYPNIEFTGWKNNNEVYGYMKNAKALIFPSRWYEGAPLTVPEAMSIGLPCIISDCCAAIEYVREDTNLKQYIFKSDDKNDLKEKILKLENEINEISEKTYNNFWNYIYKNDSYTTEIMEYYNYLLKNN